MDVYQKIAFVLAMLPALLFAQTSQGSQRTVRAFGQGEVSAEPDQARVQIGIVTQAATAEEASQQNATTSANVFAALKTLLGDAGDIRTSNYSVAPYWEGNPPRRAGFQVTNSVLVTVNNLGITGRIIDTAIEAGATRVDSLTLGLRDEDPVRVQALRAAGARAKQKAEAIAAGLGVRIGQLLNADEGYTVRPVVAQDTRLVSATPIEPGTLNVAATITVEYEIVP
jgi:uncharacterized protein YggE